MSRRFGIVGGFLACALGVASVGYATPPVLEDFAGVLPRLQPEDRERLQARAQRWSRWSEAERTAFAERVARWEALPRGARVEARERHAAWRALPSQERARLRAAATAFAAAPPERQQELRARFEAMDLSLQRGWLLGPELGADYPDLQPLLAQVPANEHEALLQVLRSMSPGQRRQLALLVQRTPPQERAQLRSELMSTAAGSRNDWLHDRLDR